MIMITIISKIIIITSKFNYYDLDYLWPQVSIANKTSIYICFKLGLSLK